MTKREAEPIVETVAEPGLEPELAVYVSPAAQAFALRVKGLSNPEIAERMGLRNASAASQLVNAYIRNEIMPAAVADYDEARAVELRRLDATLAVIWDKVLEGQLSAVEVMLKISQARRALLGLDAPVKHAILGFMDGERKVSELVLPEPDKLPAPLEENE